MLEQCGKEGPSLGGGPSNIYRKVIEGLILSYRRIYFWNYSFPLISISWAGVYDCFGRFETKSPKNPKLVVRMVFNGMYLYIFSILRPGVSHTCLPVVSPSLLFLCGLFLFFLKSIIKLNMRF